MVQQEKRGVPRQVACELLQGVEAERGLMKTSGRNSAFTLIEMMVVIVVIMILSAIVLKIAGRAAQLSGEARTKAQLEQLKNAIEEFYAAYGHYPPCEGVGYEHQGPETYPKMYPAFRNYCMESDSQLIPYSNGLVAYLWARSPRHNERNRNWEIQRYDSNTTRDVIALGKWQHYLQDVHLIPGRGPWRTTNIYGNITYRNTIDNIKNEGGGEVQYVSRPPYTSYVLFSSGIKGTEDAIK